MINITLDVTNKIGDEDITKRVSYSFEDSLTFDRFIIDAHSGVIKAITFTDCYFDNYVMLHDFNNCQFVNCSGTIIVQFGCRIVYSSFTECKLKFVGKDTTNSIVECRFFMGFYEFEKLRLIDTSMMRCDAKISSEGLEILNCNLIDVELKSCNLERCKITNCNLTLCEIVESNLRYAICNKVNIYQTEISYSDLKSINISKVVINSSKLIKSIFDNMHQTESFISQSVVLNCDFDYTNNMLLLETQGIKNKLYMATNCGSFVWINVGDMGGILRKDHEGKYIVVMAKYSRVFYLPQWFAMYIDYIAKKEYWIDMLVGSYKPKSTDILIGNYKTDEEDTEYKTEE